MTHREFCFWLKGLLEGACVEPGEEVYVLSHEQLMLVRKELLETLRPATAIPAFGSPYPGQGGAGGGIAIDPTTPWCGPSVTG